ncbi:hypothetical protein RND81_13G180800 [Saponaria officinalis]|uniref:Uncharacterized protein n=1 Tax=Saponaria officinalis TaxID=3572 RepID=A0AAW1H6P9_SAPOF
MSENIQSMKISENVVDNVATEDRQQPPVSTQLRLVSSKSLEKEVVLRRIRHQKCMNKVKNMFSSVLSFNSSGASNVMEHKLVELGDVFSCP